MTIELILFLNYVAASVGCYVALNDLYQFKSQWRAAVCAIVWPFWLVS